MSFTLHRSPLTWFACALAMAAVGCHGATTAAPPQRSCTTTAWYPASSSSAPRVITAASGWSLAGTPMKPAGDGWLAATLTLPPGPEEYAIVDGTTWQLDPTVGTTAFHDGNEVTLVDVGDCTVPRIVVDSIDSTATSTTVHATFFAAAGASVSLVDPTSLAVTERDGSTPSINATTIDPKSGAIAITLDLPSGKHTLSLTARDVEGRQADPSLAVAWVESRPEPFDWRDAVLYQVMVDRYRSGANAVSPPNPVSAFAGGDVDGVRLAIESGEIESLGVNTLWLSPLYLNPPDMFPGDGGHFYSGYHGYWPIDSRTVDPRFGGEGQVDALVASAHARGLRVLFDVVPNHVHQEHAYFAEHASDGWFHPLARPDLGAGQCVCGDDLCPWSTEIVECWFTSYLPDLAWENDAPAAQVTSDVRWWIDRFDGDGVRIDAVPMMQRSANRRIGAAIRDHYDQGGHRSLVLGENFVGEDGYDNLRYDLGPSGLDSEFDFPLMWALRDVFADQTSTMREVAAIAQEGEQTWAGSGGVASRIIGNHDVVRFASEAAGDGDGDPWTPAPPTTDPDVFSRQTVALSIVMTLPGMPTIYYGDEIALAGHGDPDSRAPMPADSTLSAAQVSMRAAIAKLGLLRGCSRALRRGDFRILSVDDEHFAFERVDAEAPTSSLERDAIIVVSRAGWSWTTPLATLDLPTNGASFVDAIGGGSLTMSASGTTFDVIPRSIAVYLPAGSKCQL